ncbi:MAG: hypothetical protein RIT45_2616 [Pseudomonadota bacterium]|jgi:predicted amidophosphoribosyltransferase
MDWLRWSASTWWWAPACCALCGQGCSRARIRLCEACGETLDPLHEAADRLDDATLMAAFRYGGPLASALVDAKFRRGALDLGGLLEPWAHAVAVRAHASGVQRFVAVPPQVDRLRDRGWHLPDLLASRLAVAANLRTSMALQRRDRGAPRSRGADVRPCFALRSGLARTHVALVDDVRTSGETLRAARDVLLAAGAEVPLCVVLADAGRGSGPAR